MPINPKELSDTDIPLVKRYIQGEKIDFSQLSDNGLVELRRYITDNQARGRQQQPIGVGEAVGTVTGIGRAMLPTKLMTTSPAELTKEIGKETATLGLPFVGEAKEQFKQFPEPLKRELIEAVPETIGETLATVLMPASLLRHTPKIGKLMRAGKLLARGAIAGVGAGGGRAITEGARALEGRAEGSLGRIALAGGTAPIGEVVSSALIGTLRTTAKTFGIGLTSVDEGVEKGLDKASQQVFEMARQRLRKLRPNATEKELTQLLGKMTSAMRTNKMALDFMDRVARAGFFSGDALRQLDVRNADSVEWAIDAMLDSLAPPHGTVASKLDRGLADITLLTNGKLAADALFDAEFGILDEIVAAQKKASIEISTTGLADSFKQEIASLRKATSFGPGADSVLEKIATRFREPDQAAVSRLANLRRLGGNPREIARLEQQTRKSVTSWTFREAHIERAAASRAAEVAESLGVPNAQEARILRRYAAEVEALMSESVDALKIPALKDRWVDLRARYKNYKDIFDNEFIKAFVAKDVTAPERLGRLIFKTGNVTSVKRFEKAMQESVKFINRHQELGRNTLRMDFDTEWKRVKVGFMSDLLNSHRTENDIINFVSIKKQMERKELLNTIRAVIGNKQTAKFQRFVQVASRIQEKSRAGTGVFALAQGNVIKNALASPIALAAGAGAVGLGFFGSAAVVLGGPALLAQVLLHGSTLDLLIKNAGGGAAALQRIAAQLAIQIARDAREVDRNIRAQRQFHQSAGRTNEVRR